MRILVFGGSGAIGRQLLPRLVAAGHSVTGATRSERTAQAWRETGLGAVVADARRADDVEAAVAEAAPDAIVHQLTDLGARDYTANARLRTLATRAIVDAAAAHGVERVVAQSVAWTYLPGPGRAGEDEPVSTDSSGVGALETAVAEVPLGVVLRYGLVYGPGTWFDVDGAAVEDARGGRLADRRSAITSFVHVADAARAAAAALDWPAGVVNVVDDDPAPLGEWMGGVRLRRRPPAATGARRRPAGPRGEQRPPPRARVPPRPPHLAGRVRRARGQGSEPRRLRPGHATGSVTDPEHRWRTARPVPRPRG
ncbi:NAD-dependent epimerase/dehydratase [Beutenbergia cavernae DSM 12333]|uniref:NAD-dependent epimerase/dehydratase n=1 Tax=Beutenbergia cavernae (strain ATCC BAA-8 / DSM 12333 / CCUG 43141 / JCM 11478 / NBRC 16432 / NCIMB 13614 / HKI 0122) TaxID=471853 RepID=C5C0B4_BEUC1|nr:NAD(P)-dependent oxidoreductase [Beutenbergia cavernae]ACQ79300.1 NAD-dependent epimerase/dehydratase [Beutenbergia cavernae DSM 12333]